MHESRESRPRHCLKALASQLAGGRPVCRRQAGLTAGKPVLQVAAAAAISRYILYGRAGKSMPPATGLIALGRRRTPSTGRPWDVASRGRDYCPAPNPIDGASHARTTGSARIQRRGRRPLRQTLSARQTLNGSPTSPIDGANPVDGATPRFLLMPTNVSRSPAGVIDNPGHQHGWLASDDPRRTSRAPWRFRRGERR